MGTVRQNSTYARVSFFTHKPFPFNRIDAYDEFADPLPDGDVQSSLVNWDYKQNIGEPGGEVQIMLKPHKVAGAPGKAGVAWPDLIEEGDWWAIDVIKNGTKQGVQWGYITRVTVQATATANGAINSNVIVMGKSAGGKLDEIPVYFNPYDAAQDNAAGTYMQKMINEVIGPADVLIRNAITGFLGGFSGQTSLLGGSIMVPAGLAGPIPTLPFRYLNALDLRSRMDSLIARGVANISQTITGRGGGSVWAFLDAWRNPAVNELFLDSGPRPGYPKKQFVVMREKPFVNTIQGPSSPWFRLPTWNIDATLIKSIDLSRGPGRVNHVQLVGDLVASGSPQYFGAYKPRANLGSIDHHGLKRIEEHTRYFDLEGTAFHTTHNNWLNLIISWNALNHREWTGLINLGEMRTEIRPGQKIAVFNGPLGGLDVFPTDAGVPYLGAGTGLDLMTFYVESVQHQWAQNGGKPTAKTNLLVSRGYVEGVRAFHLALETASNWQSLAFTGQGAPLTGTGSINVLPGSDPIVDAQVDAATQKGAFNPGDHETED
jgi:hypothetical protein